jgi:hypothetical protein
MKTIKTLTIEVVDEKGTITATQEINCAIGKNYKLLITMEKNTYMINLDDYKISKIKVWAEQNPKERDKNKE